MTKIYLITALLAILSIISCKETSVTNGIEIQKDQEDAVQNSRTESEGEELNSNVQLRNKSEERSIGTTETTISTSPAKEVKYYPNGQQVYSSPGLNQQAGGDKGALNTSGSGSGNGSTASPAPSQVVTTTGFSTNIALNKGFGNTSAYSTPPQDNGEAGKITAGELNDLSEWEFWKDIASERLSMYQELWATSPSDRVVFSVQNKEGIPLIGARIELYSTTDDKNPIWISRSDNTGFAQLFGKINHNDESTTISHAIVSYKGESKRIRNPKMFNESINTVQFEASCKPSEEVDIAFVVDATGSMQDEIDFLKKDLLDIIETSVQSDQELKINMASLFYRCQGNSYVTKHSDFSADLNQTINFIKEQNADEGGDEVVALALKESINNLSWRDEARTKLLFIVLDEPPGASPEVVAAMKEVYLDASEKGIKIIPCVASGTSMKFDKTLEYLMRTGAMLTNGTYVFFTNDSGVGGNHTLPIVKSYEVEKLNALLKRIIKSNITVTECSPEVDPDAIADTGNNYTDETKNVLDSLLALHNDSLSIMNILPYTIYDTYDDFNKNRPLDSLDTVRFLNDYSNDVIEWKAFPNPTMGPVTLETTKKIDAIHILDFHGRLLQRIEPGDRLSSELDFSAYPRGTYIVSMLVGEQKLTARIVKM